MGVVMKFGGTSVGTIEQINDIAHHIKNIKEQDQKIVIVVSAMGKRTDELIQLAKSVSNNLPRREIDTLLATGEQQTIALLTIALKGIGVDAISLTGFQAGFITTSSHTKGIIKDVNITRVLQHLKTGKVVVVAGFQGITNEGDITTFGRGGSDTSAVALAAKLGYPCEIYTDVDGIYTVDPRLYNNAKKLDKLSFEEMMEMASLGAGVVETRSIELAKKYNVPLYIAKSLSKKGTGTYIMNETYLFEEKPITGISVTDNVAMVTLEGVSNNLHVVSNVFNLLSSESINLDMISQSIDKENNLMISFSIDDEDVSLFNNLVNENKNIFNNVKTEVAQGLIKLSLVGVGMASNFGVAAKVFDTLAKASVPFYHISTSEISISCTVSNDDKNKAVENLAKAFHL